MSSVLLITSFSIAFFHTILGPDHYIPFIALSKTKQWSLKKLLVFTVLCGMGHVLSSVFLGVVGISIGAALIKLELIESFRGDIAGWLLLIFGFVYFIYGLFVAKTHKRHNHIDTHAVHTHTHDSSDKLHTHTGLNSHKKNVTPWVLFIIFLLGPCEPLIPLLMYPAATLNGTSVLMVSLVFGITTILTMCIVVSALYFSMTKINFKRFEQYSHAIAGFAIFACGFAVSVLGL
jgi:nickel/cobalt transporter (NicO) family protein